MTGVTAIVGEAISQLAPRKNLTTGANRCPKPDLELDILTSYRVENTFNLRWSGKPKSVVPLGLKSYR